MSIYSCLLSIEQALRLSLQRQERFPHRCRHEEGRRLGLKLRSTSNLTWQASCRLASNDRGGRGPHPCLSGAAILAVVTIITFLPLVFPSLSSSGFSYVHPTKWHYDLRTHFSAMLPAPSHCLSFSSIRPDLEGLLLLHCMIELTQDERIMSKAQLSLRPLRSSRPILHLSRGSSRLEQYRKPRLSFCVVRPSCLSFRSMHSLPAWPCFLNVTWSETKSPGPSR